MLQKTLFISAFLTLTGIMVCPADAGRRDEATLARYVPAEAPLFVEVIDAPAVLERAETSPLVQLLKALDPKRDKHAAKRAKWRHDVSALMNMPADQAIETYAGIRFALIGGGGKDRFVVLSRVPEKDAYTRLVSAVKAAPAGEYHGATLSSINDGQTLLAHVKGVLVIGSAVHRELFEASLDRLGGRGGPVLADDKDFKTQTSKLPDGAKLLIFVRPNAVVSRQQKKLKIILDNVPACALGGYLLPDGEELRLSARLDTEKLISPPAKPIRPTLMTKLDARTIGAVWASVDISERLSGDQADDKKSSPRKPAPGLAVLRILQSVIPDKDPAEWLDEHIGGQAAMFVTTLPGKEASPVQDGPVPVFGFMIEIKNPDGVRPVVRQLATTFLMIANLALTKEHPELLLRIERENVGGALIEYVDGEALAKTKTDVSFFHTLDLAWMLSDDRLVVASSREYLRRLARGKGGSIRSNPRLREVLGGPGDKANVIAFLDFGKTSSLIESLLPDTEPTQATLRRPFEAAKRALPFLKRMEAAALRIRIDNNQITARVVLRENVGTQP